MRIVPSRLSSPPWRPALLPMLARLVVMIALLLPARSSADDAALYGPAAPAGSAFIRVFNASDDPELEVRVGDEMISEITPWNVSDFIFLPAGNHVIAATGEQQSAQLVAGRYYTAVAGAGGIELLDNAYSANRLKSQVILYNLTGSSALSLRTRDGATEVISDVAAAAHGSREVNPAPVQFVLYEGDQRLADAPSVRLARGRVFSLFAVGDADKPRLVWAVN